MEHTITGRKHWAIAEGYIPTWSHGKEPEMTSHETVCLLNANDGYAAASLWDPTVSPSQHEGHCIYALTT